MAMIFLNLRQVNPFGRIVSATCAISGAPGALRGIARTFSDVQEAAETLAAAGIADPLPPQSKPR